MFISTLTIPFFIFSYFHSPFFSWYLSSFLIYFNSIIVQFIIILLIKNSLQCKAGRELEHYQSEDPNPTESYKMLVGKKGEQIRPTRKHWLCSENPPVPHHQTHGLLDRSIEILRGAQRSCGTKKILQQGGVNECR